MTALRLVKCQHFRHWINHVNDIVISVDFTSRIVSIQRSLLIKRQSSEDADGVSFMTFIGPLKFDAWLSLFVFYALLCLTSLVITLFDSWKSRVNTVGATLKAIIGKGSTMQMGALSRKVGFFTILTSTMLILIYYKGIMKSFLTIKTTRYPYETFEDILDSDLEVIVFHGAMEEEHFKHAPEGSVMRQIYLEKIKDKKSLQDIGGYAKVHDYIHKGGAVIWDSKALMARSHLYPCGVTFLPTIK